MVLVILKRMKDNRRKSAAYHMNNKDQLTPLRNNNKTPRYKLITNNQPIPYKPVNPYH